MHTVTKHLIKKAEIPATPQLPTSNSSSNSLHRTGVTPHKELQQKILQRLDEKREEHILMHCPPPLKITKHPQKSALWT
jgi:hypothetical protein